MAQTDIHRIQIFGERCSGTNYLQALLERNLPRASLCRDYGFKHFFPRVAPGQAPDCLFVIIYREPLDWLSSLYRNPWHVAPELRRLPFSDFIRHEWWCVWDEDAGVRPGDERYGSEMLQERCPDTGRRFRDVLAMRSSKIRAWEALRDTVAHAVSLNYETLRRDPAAAIARLEQDFGLRTAPRFRDVRQYKGGRWYQGWRARLLRKPPPAIGAADRDYILARLDQALERRIGYVISAAGLENRTD